MQDYELAAKNLINVSLEYTKQRSNSWYLPSEYEKALVENEALIRFVTGVLRAGAALVLREVGLSSTFAIMKRHAEKNKEMNEILSAVESTQDEPNSNTLIYMNVTFALFLLFVGMNNIVAMIKTQGEKEGLSMLLTTEGAFSLFQETLKEKLSGKERIRLRDSIFASIRFPNAWGKLHELIDDATKRLPPNGSLDNLWDTMRSTGTDSALGESIELA